MGVEVSELALAACSCAAFAFHPPALFGLFGALMIRGTLVPSSKLVNLCQELCSPSCPAEPGHMRRVSTRHAFAEPSPRRRTRCIPGHAALEDYTGASAVYAAEPSCGVIEERHPQP